MTAAQAIARFDELEPNPWSQDEKLRWLAALEANLEEGVFARHTGTPAPHGEVTPETVLHAGTAREGMYLWYLSAMHHLYSGEITRYNNDMTLFTAAYGEYIRWVHREHEPRGERVKVT